jgi:hypothetical protein
MTNKTLISLFVSVLHSHTCMGRAKNTTESHSIAQLSLDQTHELWYKSCVDMFIFCSINKIVWIPIIQMEQPLTKNHATKKWKNGGLQWHMQEWQDACLGTGLEQKRCTVYWSTLRFGIILRHRCAELAHTIIDTHGCTSLIGFRYGFRKSSMS